MGAKIKGINQRGKIYWLRTQKNGRLLQMSLETEDYVEAVKKAALILQKPDLNPTQGLKADLALFTKYQLEHHLWTESTEDSKGAVLQKFGRWCHWLATDEIRPRHVLDWYEALRKEKKKNGEPLHEGTAHTYLNALRSFFKWAVEQKPPIARENPVVGLNLGQVLHAPRRKFCTYEQRDQILAGAPNDDLRFILYCGFHAGLRKKEIIEARPEWFDIERGVLHVVQTATFVPKDKEDRTVPLTAEFKKFLTGYGLRSPYMLKPDVKKGKSVYRYDFDRPYFNYLVPLGYRWVTPHVMRHTFGSLLASSGCSIFKIAVWMGDEVRTAQKHYAHLLPVDSDIELATRPKVKEPAAPVPDAPRTDSPDVGL